MKKIVFAIFLILMVLSLSLLDHYRPPGTSTQAKETDLVVHEWGTFTSIAGKNGVALDWRPLNGASDLPNFVYTEAGQGGYRGTHGISGKGIARVRMETPVIYFYSPKEIDVNVDVRFPEGKITEWYPQAAVVNSNYAENKTGQSFGNGVNWGTIKLLPNEKENFLREAAYSHYYPARETDAVQLQICNADKSKIEHEKFLFYRGVGNFALPLNVALEGDKVVLSENDTAYPSLGKPERELVDMIVFENRGGRIGFRYVPKVTGKTIVERPVLGRTMEEVYSQLEKTLTVQGLYLKEAKAMIKTWQDSWFEEGLRVFYILPRYATDKILPLHVNPQPKQTVRVLVGRAEIITPETERDVKRQVALLRSPSKTVRESAAADLRKHGRFYEPILKSILESEKNAAVRAELERLIAAVE
jgi:hypothetical protein